MQRRITLVLAAVAALCLVVAIPASAAKKGSKTDRAQNKALKAYGKAIKKNAKSIRGQSKSVKTLNNSAKSLNSSIKSLKEIADRADKSSAAITAGVPTIVKGLTDLKTGLLAAGAGLTQLKTLATSQEYGIAQMIVLEGGTTPNPQEGSFLETPDIPDTVQQGMTTQQFVAQQAGTLIVAYGVRSNEKDGTGASDPAAACKVTVTDEEGGTETTAPNAALGGVPFQFVNTKSSLTSTVAGNEGFPFGLKTVAPDADVTQNLTTALPVVAGETYTVGMSCVDTTPSPTDPGA